MNKIAAMLVLLAAFSLAGCEKPKAQNQGNITTVTKLPNNTTVTTVTTPQGRVLSRTSDGPI